MSQHLQDKVVVITGAGSGFGKLIAEKCAAGGARVVGVDIGAENLAAVFDGIRAARLSGTHQVADVTDMDHMKGLVQHAVQTFGAVDVIVNNAGVMPLTFFADDEQAWQQWHRAIDINISSIYGNAGVAGSGVYSATKAAVTVLSDSLRSEAKGKIKVTTVKPTGVLGTNLGSGVVNGAATMGVVGSRADDYVQSLTAFANGTLPVEQTDVDSVKYWLITPDDLAEAVVRVIDQPWGIRISDITVRASGEDYIY